MFTKATIIALCVTCSFALFPTSEVTRCKTGDADCILKSANEFVRKNAKGNDRLGLQQIDPFLINNITMNDQSGSDSVKLNMHIKKAEVYGLSKTHFSRVVGFTKDRETSKFEMYGSTPELKIVGQYKAEGRVILLPIQGEGDFEFSIKDCAAGIKLKPVFIERNGLHYARIKKLKLLMEPKKFDLKLTNLFNGNKELGDALLAAINENWRDVWNEMAPAILKTVADVMIDYSKPFFDKYDYEDFYLPE